jgi:hypothetical protein
MSHAAHLAVVSFEQPIIDSFEYHFAAARRFTFQRVPVCHLYPVWLSRVFFPIVHMATPRVGSSPSHTIRHCSLCRSASCQLYVSFMVEFAFLPLSTVPSFVSLVRETYCRVI